MKTCISNNSSWLFLVIFSLIILTGCAKSEVVEPCLKGHEYGFFGGLWHGFIAPFDFIAMLFNGVFAATMSLLWSIGSVYFCKTEEASEYQSIHLTFTGLRSFFAPLLGVWIYWLVGFTATFLTGVVLLAIAVGISLKSQKKYSL